jgi:DNA-directed RNA polymerase specialized sigma24 family protein
MADRVHCAATRSSVAAGGLLMSAVALYPVVVCQPVPPVEPAVVVAERVARGRWYTPLELIAARLQVLDGDSRWRMDGTAIAGLPDRPLSLAETGCRLLDPATPFTARDNAFDWLLDRIHTSSGDAREEWNVVLAGMLLPGLRASLTPACRRHRTLRADIEVEALAGLWAAADRTPVGQGRVAARLTWAARRAADQYIRGERTHRAIVADTPLEDVPEDVLAAGVGLPAVQPDVLLAAAVSGGVLAARDAELIALTRLEGVDFQVAATRLGLSYPAARQCRSRAEARLVGWIHRRQAQTAR